METIAIVLTVGDEHREEFERGFKEHEVPVWEDFLERGLLVRASLTPLEISTLGVKGASQYLVVAVFADDRGHHEHDGDPRFRAWDQMADAYQVAPAHALGGETLIRVGD